MGLNETPSGERVHIGFFGVRNAGKSSVVNAVTGPGSSVTLRTHSPYATGREPRSGQANHPTTDVRSDSGDSRSLM